MKYCYENNLLILKFKVKSSSPQVVPVHDKPMIYLYTLRKIYGPGRDEKKNNYERTVESNV